MKKRIKPGFSLIEINLAIFLVAMGMLTLFSLFPTGLKQIENASDDTQEAFFADYVLNTLRSNAPLIPSDKWNNMSEFTTEIMLDLPADIQVNSGIQSADYPDSENKMRYILEISDDGNNMRMAKLWCRAGEYGAASETIFKDNAVVFITKFVYSGMP